MTEQVTQPENSKKRLYQDIAAVLSVFYFVVIIPMVIYYFSDNGKISSDSSGVATVVIFTMVMIGIFPIAFGFYWLTYRFVTRYYDTLVNIGTKYPFTTKIWFRLILVLIYVMILVLLIIVFNTK